MGRCCRQGCPAFVKVEYGLERPEDGGFFSVSIIPPRTHINLVFCSVTSAYFVMASWLFLPGAACL